MIIPKVREMQAKESSSPKVKSAVLFATVRQLPKTTSLPWQNLKPKKMKRLTMATCIQYSWLIRR